MHCNNQGRSQDLKFFDLGGGRAKFWAKFEDILERNLTEIEDIFLLKSKLTTKKKKLLAQLVGRLLRKTHTFPLFQYMLCCTFIVVCVHFLILQKFIRFR